MSIISSSSTVTEVPGVNNAVQHLQELGVHMKHVDLGFREEDVAYIHGVIEALQDLQVERSRIQQDLEVETIEASILRHRLQFLPDQIKQEIAVAVNSARQSNAAELTRLREKLGSINENIEFLETRHKDLEQENSVLHPERDKVRQEHEEIIMQLNRRLAEKAGKQIVLNETRDKLRETNQKIVDMEECIMQLKEDLIQERADARMEKKRLKKAVYDTTLKTREQKEANVAKKKEVDVLHDKVMDSETELNKIRKIIRRLETSKSRLEGQERALVSQLNKETKQNQELRIIGSEIGRQIEEEQTAFTAKEQGLNAKIKELDELIAKEVVRNEALSQKKNSLAYDLEGKMKIRNADLRRVNEANTELQTTKAMLASKAEEAGRLTQENADMEERMEELAETHESIVKTLSKQIDEAREQLSKERKERIELQGERDVVQKEVDDFKQTTNKYMSEMNRKINEGKNQHDELTKEGIQLQKALRQDDETIKKLKQDLQKAKDNFVATQATLTKELESLEMNIKTLEETLQKKDELLKERTPVFTELEKVFQETSQEYDKTKKEIVNKKNQKNGLDDTVKRSKREIEKMVNPKNEVEANIKKKREELLELLKHQAAEVRGVETNIYTLGCKLKTAIEENDRFREANENMESDIRQLETQIKENTKIMDKLCKVMADIRKNLAQEWNSDHELEKEFAKRDEVLVVELGHVLASTEKREQVISGITDKLEAELSLLAHFLDNVASRRPKEKTPDSKKSPGTLDSSSDLPDTARSNTLTKAPTTSRTIDDGQVPGTARQKESPGPPDTGRGSVMGYTPLPPITPTNN